MNRLAPLPLNAESSTPLSPQDRRRLESSLQRLQRYAANSHADATRRAYRADLEHFAAWCSVYGRSWLPASGDTVALYIGTYAEELSLSTLERRLAAISSLHKQEGHESPATVSEPPLRAIWRGLVKEKTRAKDKAEPLMAADLRQIIEALPKNNDGSYTLASLRDRAMLLLGWAGALRRSELVAVEIQHLRMIPGEGFNLTVPRSKSDQEGEGIVKGIPYGASELTCPVLAVRRWITQAEISDGPLFRRFYRGGSIGEKALTAQYVSRKLKEHAARIGLDPAKYSAHSLRSGFITQAIFAGKRDRRVKEHSAHKSWQAFNEYVKHAGTFQENPAKDVGL